MAIKKKKAAHGEDGVIKFVELIKQDNLSSVLDIGSGDYRHYNYMKKQGLDVFSNDLFSGVDYPGNFNNIDIDFIFDGVHAAHVLEHQPNVNLFLTKIKSILREGGYLCITVPPFKHGIVGGHVSIWNAGLILYNLVLAGFDCKNAKIKQYGYNISVIIKKKTINEEYNWVYDGPDMAFVAKYLPPFNFTGSTPKTPGSFNGDIREYNW